MIYNKANLKKKTKKIVSDMNLACTCIKFYVYNSKVPYSVHVQPQNALLYAIE